MKEIQRAKGMRDILPEDQPYWARATQHARALARRYGFLPIDIPIMEVTELFARGVGEGSDFFVQKEMYSVDEGDGTTLTLRPEFTAGMVRAYVQNGMANWPQPVKLYTIGPAFRRERPQAGRFRQHSQFDAEILGVDDPAADVEIIMLAHDFYRGLGYKPPGLHVNSTGCPICKPAYIERLRAYIAPYSATLSEVDQRRLAVNPLRLLDSKEPGMAEILAGAPHIADHLCDDCDGHFAALRDLLDALDQPYEVNFRLVRGIDYYTKTVFEFWDSEIGAQSSIGGGGRYDGLAEAIGGPPTPGVGVGIGLDRVIMGLQQQDVTAAALPPPLAMLIHFGGETKAAAVQMAHRLRGQGVVALLAFARGRRSMKSMMREADKRGARFAVIVGEDEIATGQAMVRDLSAGTQTTVDQAALADHLLAADAG